MAELLIRPSMNDHVVLADLLAPSPVSPQRPISRVVINAHDATRNPKLAELAAKAGVPVLVDPLTVLLQSDVDPEDPWVRTVSYGVAPKLSSDAMANTFLMDQLVAQAVELQIEHGATAIIPPYFYADDPRSPAFAASLGAIGRTSRRLRLDGIALPVVPVLCAQLRGFAHGPRWRVALDQFIAAATDVGPQSMGLCLSPVGDGKESYSKLLDLMTAARHLRSSGVPVLAWRQGIYGPALVAAGIDGYECGMGIGEQTNISAFQSARKPRERDSKGFAAQAIYVSALGRSLPPKVARTLLDDRRLRGRLICTSLRCCPHGTESMLQGGGRAHAVRSRARELSELLEIPNRAWRLHHIGKQAASANVTARKANDLLAAEGIPNRVHTAGYDALEQVTDFLRQQEQTAARDTA